MTLSSESEAPHVSISYTDDGDSLLGDIAWRLLARRSLIVRTIFIAVVGTLVVSFALPRWYTSSLSFTPQGRRAASGNLSGLAAQFGVALPTSEASQSPGFYAQLATTEAILGTLASRTLSTDSVGSIPGESLSELLGVNEKEPRRRHEEIIKELRKRISTGAEVRTGVVWISVKMHDPVSSWRLSTLLLNALTEYNLTLRQGQARAERTFAEARMKQAKVELQAAEEQLRAFLVGNREQMQRSATLALEEKRLEREISTRSQVYQTIVQAYEQARLEEVRDTPMLSLIDNPRIAGRADSLRLPVRVLIATLLATGFACTLSLLLDLVARVRTGALHDVDKDKIRRRIAYDLARPWRLLFTSTE